MINMETNCIYAGCVNQVAVVVLDYQRFSHVVYLRFTCLAAYSGIFCIFLPYILLTPVTQHVEADLNSSKITSILTVFVLQL